MLLQMLTGTNPEVSEEVVEETLSVAEKIVDWFDKPGVQALMIVGGIVVGCILAYEFGIKRLLRKLR